MTKKIKKLEKETTLWRTKWETNNQTLLQMAEEVRNTCQLIQQVTYGSVQKSVHPHS